MNLHTDKNFLAEYLNTASPSGYEEVAQKVWLDKIKSECGDKVETIIDDYGNAYATYRPSTSSEGKRHLIIDAHADEIGFFVFDITPEGYIKVGRLGGSDVTITGSTKVDIWPLKGTGMTGDPIKGVFGHPAIHVQETAHKFNIDEMFIDLGVSTEEEVRKMGIEIGSPITMERDFFELGEYYSGKSLDDKIGGYVTAMLLTSLVENNVELDYTLTVINSVQEEVGLRGAQMSIKTVNSIEPGAHVQAIAIDVCHCTNSPAYNINKSGSNKSGKGPVIMTAPSIHNKLSKTLMECYEGNGIPLQYAASGRSSGTNADSFAYIGTYPTALMKVALKYMHTTVEMVHSSDVDNLVKGLYLFTSGDYLPKSSEALGNKL